MAHMEVIALPVQQKGLSEEIVLHPHKEKLYN